MNLDKPTIEVWCRKCGALPNRPCRTYTSKNWSKVIKRLHPERTVRGG